VPREVIGLGDLKLLAMIGAFLGPEASLFVLMSAALIGTAVGTALLCLPRWRRNPVMPFGPFLAGGAGVWILAGPEIVAWYTNLLMRAYA
jgi:leader peptidase (prepilin peptidase)/N-methyltransferase